MPTEGDKLKAEAMARAASAAPEEWKANLLECIRLTALRLPKLNTDPVMELFEKRGHRPHTENRAIGPVFVRAAKLGYIKKTETMPSHTPTTRPNMHSAPIQNWDSLIFIGVEELVA